MSAHEDLAAMEQFFMDEAIRLSLQDGNAPSPAVAAAAAGPPARAPAPVQTAASAAAPAPAAAASAAAASAPAAVLRPGLRVLYDSRSYGVLMPAVVLRVHGDGSGRVDLDVKERADPRRVRLRPGAALASASPSAASESAAPAASPAPAAPPAPAPAPAAPASESTPARRREGRVRGGRYAQRRRLISAFAAATEAGDRQQQGELRQQGLAYGLQLEVERSGDTESGRRGRQRGHTPAAANPTIARNRGQRGQRRHARQQGRRGGQRALSTEEIAAGALRLECSAVTGHGQYPPRYQCLAGCDYHPRGDRRRSGPDGRRSGRRRR